MILKYKLNELSDNFLGRNIYRKRHKLLPNIIKFSKQEKNDGIHAENIVRLTLDAINLNHFHKNHPHVDLGVMVPIPGVTKRNEILSIKSSINYKSTANLLTDTKAIKIESLFSYLLFAYYNFDTEYIETINSPNKLLEIAIKEANLYSSYIDYKKIVQITIFYLMFNNIKNIENDFKSDIKNLINDENLKYGTYSYYDNKVNKELNKLNSPISLGVCYIDKKNKDDDNITCVIKKTYPIELNKYWNKLLDIWCTREYFGATNEKGGKVTKYLRYDDICDIYNIEYGDEFPIEIRIETGEYKNLTNDNKTRIHKDETDKRVKKMYVATKFKDANFKDNDSKIIRTFNKMIDILEYQPNLVTKFDNFIKNIKKDN